VRLDTAVHLFDAYVRPTWEYACGLWGAMLSKDGVSTLEGLQSEFARRVLQLGGARVAHAYLRAELGLRPVGLRVLQATLSLFGMLRRLPDSRLAGHVFRNRYREVRAGAGKYSWCVVAEKALRGAGFEAVWLGGRLPDSWKKKVREHCDARFAEQLRADVEAHSSLALFHRVGRFSGVDSWLRLEVQHPGRRLKVRLRAGALPLMVHVGASNGIEDRRLRRCVMCRSGAIETDEHFVAACPYYEDLRAGCLERLHMLFERAGEPRPQVGFLELVAGSGSSAFPASLQLRAEKCGWDFLRLAWARREVIWRQVCLDGNPWRLPAPR